MCSSDLDGLDEQLPLREVAGGDGVVEVLRGVAVVGPADGDGLLSSTAWPPCGETLAIVAAGIRGGGSHGGRRLQRHGHGV